jgi:Tfp pilus assembly PilM family ATPase
MILTRKTGWIGVDVGTSSIKVAQLVRQSGRWRLAWASIVPRREEWSASITPDAAPCSSLDEFNAVRSLESGFQGRRVAATLPMSVCDVHTLDRDLEGEPRADAIIRKVIELTTQQSIQPLEFDYWTGSSAQPSGNSGWTNVLTAVRSWGDQLADDVARAGWSCHTIDGVPLALARAVELVHGDDTGKPVAALDWGFARATLVVVVEGRPAYVRCLKDCGWQRVLAALGENLQVSRLEAEALVTAHGLPNTKSDIPSEASELIREIIAEPLDQLVEEVARSLEHFQYQRRTAGPRRLYLFGGGATLHRLDAELSARLAIDARVWQLNRGGPATGPAAGAAGCLFGPAVALSALAWQKIPRSES